MFVCFRLRSDFYIARSSSNKCASDDKKDIILSFF